MIDPTPIKYPGVALAIGGTTYIVPALSLNQYSTYFQMLKTPLLAEDAVSVEEYFRSLIPVVGAAIRRNYPSVSNEYLADELTTPGLKEVLEVVQGASNLPLVGCEETEKVLGPWRGVFTR